MRLLQFWRTSGAAILLSSRIPDFAGGAPGGGDGPARAGLSQDRFFFAKPGPLTNLEGLCDLVGRLQTPGVYRIRGQFAESLRPLPRIFPFLGDWGRRPGSIATAWRRRRLGTLGRTAVGDWQSSIARDPLPRNILKNPFRAAGSAVNGLRARSHLAASVLTGRLN
jgi:hypothetical protein